MSWKRFFFPGRKIGSVIFLSQVAFLILVVVFLVYSINEMQFDSLVRELANGEILFILLSLFFAISANLALFVNWLLIQDAVSNDVTGRLTSFYVFSVGQLGKYVPGGIWTIVGHKLVARNSNGSPKTASISIILLLQITASGLSVGAGFGILAGSNSGLYGAAFSVALFAWWASIALSESKIMPYKKQFYSSKNLLKITFSMLKSHSLIGVSIWLSFGLSFFFVLVAIDPAYLSPQSLTSSISIYPLAHVGGMLAFFAPAGIGVREIILSLLFEGEFSEVFQAASLVIMRLVTILSDLAIAIFAFFIFKAKIKNA